MIIKLIRANIGMPGQLQAHPNVRIRINQAGIERVSEAVEVKNVWIGLLLNFKLPQKSPKVLARGFACVSLCKLRKQQTARALLLSSFENRGQLRMYRNDNLGILSIPLTLPRIPDDSPRKNLFSEKRTTVSEAQPRVSFSKSKAITVKARISLKLSTDCGNVNS